MGNESIIDTPNFAPMNEPPKGGGIDWESVFAVALGVLLLAVIFSY